MANAAVAALAALQLLWELWLAPVRPGGSWLALKAVPLALLLPGLLRGSARARNIAALALMAYFVEGVVRAASEHGRSQWIAASAALLAVLAFVALFMIDRAQARARGKQLPTAAP
ncbi:MAG: DUF2069 domain-containing protein [Pseudomonadota bacterium]|nr:DUF2069 domain-containing protein [Pseudomonadota bacterium]